MDGGSAGGYTTLCCLIFSEVFSAGVCFCGVSDLQLIKKATHKFESRYLDKLISPSLKEQENAYSNRAPIKHLDKLQKPVAFMHSALDQVLLSPASVPLLSIEKSGIISPVN